jgi:hypothetical protein
MMGIFIIIIGILALLSNLGIIGAHIWSILWPILLILVGLKMVLKKKGMLHGHEWYDKMHCKCHESKEPQESK